ncbi:TIGR03842 family LLM class F420-dependent oxidoreductase [Streptomyces sp. NPDC099050]|uniref:TIGR03842 family LLM class F420-dependent oxidoreductase n=1 Tax=Streptomyces sp. NPDC099050 TaxID=3366100 RepID=UPI003804A22C
MDFGLVLQTDPPASQVVSLMKRGERNGFRYGWTFDSAVLWQEPFVIYSQILANTQRMHGKLPVWMAAYGPKALALAGQKADGSILQLADLYLTEWMIKAVRQAAVEAGRDPGSITICVAAPAYVGDDLAHARDQCRWFGGMVGNHVADLVSRYGEHSSMVPDELTEYVKSRQGYDYSHHGRSGNPSADFVPDEIVDRFCLLGPAEAHIEKLRDLRDLGVDQFALYNMHDAREAVIDAYGQQVIPALDG